MITGGVGISGNANIGGNLTVLNNTIFSHTDPSVSSTTGALVVSGGVGIGGNVNIGGNLTVTKNTTQIGNVVITNANPATNINTGALVVSGGASIGANVYVAGNVTIFNNITVCGTISSGIPHPILPNKRLVHSFTESPRCDIIYRGTIVLVHGSAIVNIDTDCTHDAECAMTDGTFVNLCTNVSYYLQTTTSFHRVIGDISGNKLTITSEKSNSTDTINWLVIGERNDPFIKNWNKTNQNGFLITEHSIQPDDC